MELHPVGVSLCRLQVALTDDTDASGPAWLDPPHTAQSLLSGTLEVISAEEDQYSMGLLSVKTVADGKHQVDLGNSHITFLNSKSRGRYYEAGFGASEGTPGYVLIENYLHQSFM